MQKTGQFFSQQQSSTKSHVSYVTIYTFELFLLSVETLTSPSAVHSVSNRGCYHYRTERIDLVFLRLQRNT